MAEIARSELILGGQKSGKSRRAETLARHWLGAAPDRAALLIASALPGDAAMRERIERHQRDRARRVPGLQTLEEPLDLAAALEKHSTPQTLLVVDCLTLWLTNWLMPAQGDARSEAEVQDAVDDLVKAVQQAPGPVVLVGNEIGLGVIPLGREVRGFVDALGLLNQSVAGVCERVVFMAAGLPLVLKGSL
ncbi:MAG: bifunctional adenosylcobinamide kinase/adenosylcobinamide-phosphate guanylyltransferase [Hydrogenophaga sp.]|jgi:adenosylcobinamide kinase/adenosylcobinamide-phosphate guanylyltransferase|nr:bifunctional adenosylcobinamide kinase/adenosylcobinamide-phosphate guanylyltransferase [Hydrogenophaga sp.]